MWAGDPGGVEELHEGKNWMPTLERWTASRLPCLVSQQVTREEAEARMASTTNSCLKEKESKLADGRQTSDVGGGGGASG